MYWNVFDVNIFTGKAQAWRKLAADNVYKDEQFSLPYQYSYLGKPECE